MKWLGLQSAMILSQGIGSYMTITLSENVLAGVFASYSFRKKQEILSKRFLIKQIGLFAVNAV